jgi:hypothetical protein
VSPQSWRSGAAWLYILLTGALVGGCGSAQPPTAPSAAPAAAAPAAPPVIDVPPGGGFPPVDRIVWGRALDFDTNTPLAGARVSLWHSPGGINVIEVIAVTTGVDGRFNITATTIGFWMVRVARTGYEPAQFAHYSESAPFDFAGDVALRVYPTLVVKPGESIDVQVAATQPTDSCGPEGWLYCRRVVVESPADAAVTIDATAIDGQGALLTDEPNFDDWNKPSSPITVSSAAIWVVWTRRTYGTPNLRARLTARHP